MLKLPIALSKIYTRRSKGELRRVSYYYYLQKLQFHVGYKDAKRDYDM